ncbi:MAG: magnesium/cobalt transporter CorA [Propionibacteriaceae bacterium]|nr:magnesium/cobalt transporter CorA [Propionibacteriaceae bacterium]
MTSPLEANPFEAVTYRAGTRIQAATTMAQTQKMLRADAATMAWIWLNEPNADTITQLSEYFPIHPLAIEDAIQGQQRPKLDRYDESIFTALHPAIISEEGSAQIGELHVIVGTNYAITIRHDDFGILETAHQRFDQNPQLAKSGSLAVLYCVLDVITDSYLETLETLQDLIDEYESQIFEGNFTLSHQIYSISKFTADFSRVLRSTQHLTQNLISVYARQGEHPELRVYLNDVEDHLTRALERSETIHSSLWEILNIQSTLVAQQQNIEMRLESTQMKRISGWAAILFAPSLITGIYGMNFAVMPELDWLFGYLFALAMMLTIAFILYLIFKRKGWL